MTDNQTLPPVTVTLEDGPTGAGSIDDFELFHARRALDRFRTLLGRQGLLDLLAADIEEGNAFLRESARTSDGSFKAGTTVLATKGLTSGAFLAWMDKAFAGDESALLAAHPEHYVMGTDSIGARAAWPPDPTGSPPAGPPWDSSSRRAPPAASCAPTPSSTAQAPDSPPSPSPSGSASVSPSLSSPTSAAGAPPPPAPHRLPSENRLRLECERRCKVVDDAACGRLRHPEQ